MEIKPGIYENVPFEEYGKWPAFSQSGIRHILRSPKHYMHWVMCKDESSGAQVLGNLVDCLVLEPEQYSYRYIIKPSTYGALDKKTGETIVKPWNANSNTCKEILIEIEKSGKTAISEEDYHKATAMAESVMLHQSAREMVALSKKQVSLAWVDSDTGVLCKGRLDMVNPTDAVNDLKTTYNASPLDFKRHINSFGYHIQGAFYSDGWAALTANVQLPYQFIAVESDEPYCVATYSLEPDSLLTGREIYKRALRIYKECKTSGKWPGYSEYVEPIEIPAYAIKQVLEEGTINGTNDNKEGF